jgi:hypothetical protein
MSIEQLHSLANVSAADLGEVTDFDPAMIVVAAEADEAVERIVEYLASKAQLPIDFVTFTYATLDDGREIIARSILIPEKPVTGSTSTSQITWSELSVIAEERMVSKLVETLSQVASLGWFAEMHRRNGGTIIYWIALPTGGNRVLFGMNIGGEKYDSPEGTLDVWCRPEVVAEYTGLPLGSVQEQLGTFTAINQTDERIYIRLQDQASATDLYELLKKWDATSVEFRARQSEKNGVESE